MGSDQCKLVLVHSEFPVVAQSGCSAVSPRTSAVGARTAYFAPGSPWENGYCESFNATEHCLFAMPETGIGFFPDVGATWFLPRMPGEIGMYLGLTGARLGPADALYCGVATHYAPRDRLPEALDGFHADPGPPPLAEHRAAIDRCFAADSVEAIIEALEALGGDWAGETLGALAGTRP